MKIIKKLSPIEESISNVGKKPLVEAKGEPEEPIAVCSPANAEAFKSHYENEEIAKQKEKEMLESPNVQHILEATASEESRTKHFEVANRKELAAYITEAKKKNKKYKIKKSKKDGYRYIIDIFDNDDDDIFDDNDADETPMEECKKPLKESARGKYSERLWDALDNGIISSEDVAEACVKWLSDDEVEDLARANDWTFVFEDDLFNDDDDDVDYFEESIEDDYGDVYGRKGPRNQKDVYNRKMERVRRGAPLQVRDEQELANTLKNVNEEKDCDLKEDDCGHTGQGYWHGIKDVIFIPGNTKDSGTICYDGYEISAEDAEDYFWESFREEIQERKTFGELDDSMDINGMYEEYLQENAERVKDFIENYGFKVEDDFDQPEYDTEDLEDEDNYLVEDYRDSVEYKDAVSRAIKLFKSRKVSPYAVTIGYVKNKHFSPLVSVKENNEELEQLVNSLKTKAKAKTDVSVEAIYANNIEEYENLLNENFNEALQIYASSLKDFKPAKEAEELWNEIVEKGKLDDLEYELENVLKSDDDENASIDVEGLNDLLVNHPDFIRTLIGLDGAPIDSEEDDSDFDKMVSGVHDGDDEDHSDYFVDDEEEEEPLKEEKPKTKYIRKPKEEIKEECEDTKEKQLTETPEGIKFFKNSKIETVDEDYTVDDLNKDEEYDNFYGLKGLHVYFPNGKGSDPHVYYKDLEMNYYDLENAMWEDFKEDLGDKLKNLSENELDTEFEKWLKENESHVQNYFLQAATETPEELEEGNKNSKCSLTKKEPEIKLDEDLEDDAEDDEIVANNFLKERFTTENDNSTISVKPSVVSNIKEDLDEDDEDIVDLSSVSTDELLDLPNLEEFQQLNESKEQDKVEQVNKEEPKVEEKVEEKKPEECKEEVKENKDEEIK